MAAEPDPHRLPDETLDLGLDRLRAAFGSRDSGLD
jgi:hypothetical protein